MRPVTSALVAHLRVQLRPLGQYLADHTQLIKLMHQRLLAVDMFAGRQRPCHHRCMMIWRIHDHRIKFIQVLFKHLAVIRKLLGFGKFSADFIKWI